MDETLAHFGLGSRLKRNMEFDAAIPVAVVVPTDDEMNLAGSKHANWSKQWFLRNVLKKAFLLVLDDQTPLPKWLADSDNATCNSESNATLLHLRMLYAHQDFWIRLETKNISIREITEESELQFGTGSKTEALQSCDRLEVSEIVAGRSFNIYCTLGNRMRDIYIRGRVVSQICSLYVSEVLHWESQDEVPCHRVTLSIPRRGALSSVTLSIPGRDALYHYDSMHISEEEEEEEQREEKTSWDRYITTRS
ncbi:hypothetical protein PoB_004797500 [Plakobranchus ocellatus]|uniref:Uncharacterized protein n=1 Tax=Plakobranchus ocellatus TaxID=259542 RepID=A0AAV4BPT3_9GAST|nr:hypothetical protein PoB_004797500 [Plakobranchus ocellatus]